MKRALAAVAVVLLANALVLGSVAREHAGPVTRTTITVCAPHLLGGAGSDAAPAIRLTLDQDPTITPAGLDSAGLRALGFSGEAAGASGKLRDSSFLWPRQRPAWVQLRQREDSVRRFSVTEVAARREQLAPDSLSLIVRGIIGFHEKRDEPPRDSSGHQHGPPPAPGKPGIVYPMVDRIIPFDLHLDHAMLAALRAAIPPDSGCGAARPVVIATGAQGELWIEEAR